MQTETFFLRAISPSENKSFLKPPFQIINTELHIAFSIYVELNQRSPFDIFCNFDIYHFERHGGKLAYTIAVVLYFELFLDRDILFRDTR